MANHNDLELLNNFMYNMGYDMGELTDIVAFSMDIIKVSETIKKLLAFSPEEFKQTIEEFDKEKAGINSKQVFTPEELDELYAHDPDEPWWNR